MTPANFGSFFVLLRNEDGSVIMMVNSSKPQAIKTLSYKSEHQKQVGISFTSSNKTHKKFKVTNSEAFQYIKLPYMTATLGSRRLR